MTVTTEHESLGDTVRDRPEFGVELLRLFHVDIPPEHTSRLESIDFSQTMPVEYRADAATSVWVDGEPYLGLCVEIQREFVADKRQVWKVYIADLSRRLGCPVALIVMCPNAADAKRYAEPIELGVPYCAIQPFVLGPDQVPVVTDAAVAAGHPELTVFSALMHGTGPLREPVWRALATALRNFDGDHQRLYYEQVRYGRSAEDQGRSAEDQELLEAIMKQELEDSPWVQLWTNVGWEAGRAKGEAHALLRLLDGRGVAVPEATRERILACDDLGLLDTWFDRAITASTVDEVMAV